MPIDDSSPIGTLPVDPASASMPESLQIVPAEIWTEIFRVLTSFESALPQHVRPRSHPLLPSMLVCKHWNSIIGSAAILWSSVYLDLRHNTLEQIIDMCELYSFRLGSSQAILEITVNFIASPSRFLKKARVVDVERNWDVVLSMLARHVRSLVLMVPQSYRYHSIECPHLEIVRIVGTGHTSPCVVPGLGPSSAKIHTLHLDGIAPSRLENIDDWTDPIHHLIYTGSWGGLADIESSITRFPRIRSVHITLHEIHNTALAPGDSASEVLEALAMHFCRDWSGAGLERTVMSMRGVDTLRVLSLAWAYQDSGVEFGRAQERVKSFERFPFVQLGWFLRRCKDCRLSKFSLFIDANSVEMLGLRDLVLREPRLEQISELVLGAHANRTLDHHSSPWNAHTGPGLLRLVICHPAYIAIVVDVILMRHSAGSCSTRVRLELLDSFDYNDYGLRRLLFLDGEDGYENASIPEASKINPLLAKAGEDGLRIDCVCGERLIRDWNMTPN